MALPDSTPTEDMAGQARAALARTLASREFASSPRMGRFLTYLLEEWLAGRGRSLKEYGIAVAVFGKDHSFDPATNAIVRVEAGRLRRLLGEYARGSGSGEAVLLDIPKGSYVPVFRRNAGGVPAATDAGRHHVTVLACSIVARQVDDGSSAALGIREIHTLFRRHCTVLVEKYGGMIVDQAADRLIGCFGWPRPLENAAYLAAAAARDMARQARPDTGWAEIPIKVGLATGWVESAADGPVRPELLGDALARATALSLAAAGGQVLVSQSTFRILSAACRFAAVPLHLPAGETAWVLADLVAWRRPPQGREAVRLVGRKGELGLLLACWSRVLSDEGQVAVVSGEPGIGKSRLVGDLSSAVEAQGGRRWLLGTLALHAQSALAPVREAIAEAAAIERDDGSAAIIAKLAALSERSGETDPLAVPILAAMFGLSLSEALEDLAPSRRKDATFALLLRLIRAWARQMPLLVVVEDAHWLDPSTADLIHLLARSLQGDRVMLVVTSRPADSALWRRLPRAVSLDLAPLGVAEADELIGQLAGETVIPPAQRRLVIGRTEGIPLFIEEFIKTLRDVAGPVEQVPETLIDLLMTRLDRLGEHRHLAQVASVIGREFSGDVLAAVVGMDDAAFRGAIARLVEEEIILPGGESGGGMLFFRHALVRDAAYESMLPDVRRRMHERLARVLAQRHRQGLEWRPEVLAHHFQRAGLCDEAVPLWLEAGRLAAKSFANEEAVSHFRAGLAALDAVPPSPARQRWQLESLTALGVVIRVNQGYGAPELLALYERAKGLCQNVRSPDQEAETYVGLWSYFCARAEWVEAAGLAAECARHAARARHASLLLEARRLSGTSVLFQGRLGESLLLFDKVLRRYDPARYRPSHGYDPGVTAALYSAWALYLRGDEPAALARGELGLSIAKAQNHAPSTAIGLGWFLVLDMLRGDPAAATVHAAALAAVSDEHCFEHWRPLARIGHAWVATRQQGHTVDHAGMSEAIEAFCRRWGGFLSPFLWLAVADCCTLSGRRDLAVATLVKARDFVAAHTEHLWDSAILRTAGDLAGDGDEAERLFHQAIAVARQQGAVVFEQAARQSLGARASRPHLARSADDADDLQ